MTSHNPRHRHRITIGLSAAQTCSAFMPWTLPLQIGELTNRYGWSYADVGLLATFAMLLSAFTILLLTPVIPKLAPQQITMSGSLLAAIGYAVVSAGQADPTWVVAGLSISALGMGASSVAAAAYAAVAENRTKSYSIGVTVSIVFASVAFAFIPQLASPVPGLNNVYVGCAGAMLLCVIAASAAPAPPAIAASSTERLPRLVLTTTSALPGASVFLLYAATMAVYAFAHDLGRILDYSETELSLIFSVTAIAAALGPLAVALYGRAQDVRLLAAIGFLGTAVTLFLTCVPGLPVIYVAALIGQSIGQIAMSTLVFDRCFRADATGRLSSLTGSMIIVGCAIGPAIGGFLIEQSPLLLGVASVAIALTAWALFDRFEARLRSQAVAPAIVPAAAATTGAEA